MRVFPLSHIKDLFLDACLLRAGDWSARLANRMWRRGRLCRPQLFHMPPTGENIRRNPSRLTLRARHRRRRHDSARRGRALWLLLARRVGVRRHQHKIARNHARKRCSSCASTQRAATIQESRIQICYTHQIVVRHLIESQHAFLLSLRGALKNVASKPELPPSTGPVLAFREERRW